jgi:hypothetical protein
MLTICKLLDRSLESVLGIPFQIVYYIPRQTFSQYFGTALQIPP